MAQLMAPSPIHGHHTTTGHLTKMDNFIFEIGFARTIQESIYIRVNNSTLNRDISKYNLPNIWDGAVVNTSEL